MQAPGIKWLLVTPDSNHRYYNNGDNISIFSCLENSLCYINNKKCLIKILLMEVYNLNY